MTLLAIIDDDLDLLHKFVSEYKVDKKDIKVEMHKSAKAILFEKFCELEKSVKPKISN